MDTLFYNGKIYSVDENNTEYTALGVENGKIVFLGNDEEASKVEAAEKIDLQGKFMYPGFNDSHLHMLNYSFVRQSFPAKTATSIEDMIAKGSEFLKTLEGDDTQWLYGRGWNELKFTEGEKRVPDRFDLDRISTERPILLIRVCGHIAAVNTKALEIVMNLPNTSDFIEQIDQEKGILTEASIKLCYDAMTRPSVDRLKSMILLAQADMNKVGMTSVQTDNFLSLPGRPHHAIMQAYRELAEEGRMTIKVYEQPSFTTFRELKEFIDEGNRTGDGNEFYKMGPVKLYQDGSLGAKTALMNEPYEGTDSVGTTVHPMDDLQNCVDYSYDHDMGLIVHAIGDKAADMVCDAYENTIAKYGKKDVRLAINHLQIVSPDLFDRMKANDILAFIQPVFVAGDKGFVTRLVGEDRTKLSYMWKTMLNKGLKCSGGSDAPVESFDILEGIQIGVTRDRLDEVSEGWYPEEKLTVLEALRLYTNGSAYGSCEEDVKGSLEIGKCADLVVLDDDMFTVDSHAISKIKVLGTYVNGKAVYQA